MSKSRELIILPKVSKNQLGKFLVNLKNEGINIVYLDPKILTRTKTRLASLFPSTSANYVILDKDTAKPKGKKIGRKFKVLSNADIEKILDSAKKGLDFVIVEVKDWKIIPLE
ncbi:MAG: 3-dehydroquinate synthase II, partial [Thermoproteota archaeon]